MPDVIDFVEKSIRVPCTILLSIKYESSVLFKII